MTDITKLQGMLNWKLLAGSHDFPGPDGGTCINEAAIVAAGLPYRKVTSARDLPPCFCPVIGGALIGLNDSIIGNRTRQLLMRFVLQLPGSRAGRHGIEGARERQIRTQLVRAMIPYILRRMRHCEAADICARVMDHEEAVCALQHASLFMRQRGTRDMSVPLVEGMLPPNGAFSALSLYLRIQQDPQVERDLVQIAIEVLESAFSIGKQAVPIDVSLAAERMEKAKAGRVKEAV